MSSDIVKKLVLLTIVELKIPTKWYYTNSAPNESSIFIEKDEFVFNQGNGHLKLFACKELDRNNLEFCKSITLGFKSNMSDLVCEIGTFTINKNNQDIGESDLEVLVDLITRMSNNALYFDGWMEESELSGTLALAFKTMQNPYTRKEFIDLAFSNKIKLQQANYEEPITNTKRTFWRRLFN